MLKRSQKRPRNQVAKTDPSSGAGHECPLEAYARECSPLAHLCPYNDEQLESIARLVLEHKAPHVYFHGNPPLSREDQFQLILSMTMAQIRGNSKRRAWPGL